MDLMKISDIYQGKLFFIPDYQRAYAWEKEQRQDLLEDLEQLADLRKVNPAAEHYTGTIVIKKTAFNGIPAKTWNAEEYHYHEVVDGQQRLITISVLLWSIVKKLRDLPAGDGSARNIEEKYIRLNPGLPRLTLNGQQLQHFFQERIMLGNAQEPKTDAERNLLHALEEFDSYLDQKTMGYFEEDKRAWLEQYAATITSALGFVLYPVSSHHEVSVIFETMNARGKQLTQFELVKNLLMFLGGRTPSLSDPERLESFTMRVNSVWRHVIETLQQPACDASVEEDQYLRFVWALFPQAEYYEDGKRDSTFDIHKAIKMTAKTPTYVADPEKWLSAFVTYIQEYVEYYRDIVFPSFPDAFSCLGPCAEELRQLCECVNRIGREANLIPLMMATYQKFQNHGEKLGLIFGLIETFSFRILLQGRNSNAGRSKAFSLAAEVTNGTVDVDDCLCRVKSNLIEYYCNDSAVRKELDDLDENFYEWSGIRFFLWEYERWLARNQSFPFNWQEFSKHEKEQTIEHILPKGDNTLDNPDWSAAFTKEEWLTRRNSLGNLAICLPGWNSSLGNKSFNSKKGNSSTAPDAIAYINSTFPGLRQIAAEPVWNSQAIEERQRKLAEFAMERWRS